MKPVLTGLGLNGVFIFLGNGGGLPWQAVVAVVVTTVVATVVVALVQSVMPQESSDRLRLLSLLVDAGSRATAIRRRRRLARRRACGRSAITMRSVSTNRPQRSSGEG